MMDAEPPSAIITNAFFSYFVTNKKFTYFFGILIKSTLKQQKYKIDIMISYGDLGI